jgi:hypothetical protein
MDIPAHACTQSPLLFSSLLFSSLLFSSVLFSSLLLSSLLFCTCIHGTPLPRQHCPLLGWPHKAHTCIAGSAMPTYRVIRCHPAPPPRTTSRHPRPPPTSAGASTPLLDEHGAPAFVIVQVAWHTPHHHIFVDEGAVLVYTDAARKEMGTPKQPKYPKIDHPTA